jgi:hypothetical protein
MARADLTTLVEILTMPALKKEKGIFSGERVEVEWERTKTLGGEYDQSTFQTCVKIKKCTIEKLNCLNCLKIREGLPGTIINGLTLFIHAYTHYMHVCK